MNNPLTSVIELLWPETTAADSAAPEPGTVPVLSPFEYQPVFVWSRAEMDYLPGTIMEIAPAELDGAQWAFVGYDTRWGRKDTWLPAWLLSVRGVETTTTAVAS